MIEVNARIEVIKILFEQKEYELCINKVQSAMNWIKRNKELGYHREYYINFLKLTLRVCTSAFSGTKEENKDLIKKNTIICFINCIIIILLTLLCWL